VVFVGVWWTWGGAAGGARRSAACQQVDRARRQGQAAGTTVRSLGELGHAAHAFFDTRRSCRRTRRLHA